MKELIVKNGFLYTTDNVNVFCPIMSCRDIDYGLVKCRTSCAYYRIAWKDDEYYACCKDYKLGVIKKEGI
jgi:hypothetical protein